MGKIRVGMVGMGGISYIHEAGYQESGDLAEIVAMCDVDEETARNRAAAHNATVYTDYHALIADPNVDLVDITTPHRMHYPTALAALERGKHVLVEKPMAMTGAQAHHLVQVARQAGLRFTVAENTRFVTAYLAAEKLLREGALGDIRLVRTMIAGSEAIRIRSRASWVGDPNEKGVLHDSGVHTFYLLKWLFGGIRDVQAFASRILPESVVEDDATVIGHLVNGASFVSHQSCIVEAPWTERLEVYGSNGSIIIDQLTDPVGKLYSGPEDIDGTALPDVEFEPLAWKYFSIVEEVKDFVRAVADQRPPSIDPLDGAYAVQVSDAVYASLAGDGKVVSVS
jgi:UDP-N-acetylglucosamine 3-dehydrogenase